MSRSFFKPILARRLPIRPELPTNLCVHHLPRKAQAFSTGPGTETTPPSISSKNLTKKRSSVHGQPSILKSDLKSGSSHSAPARPTREIGKVIAYSTAEEYNLRKLPKRLVEAGLPESTSMFNVLGEAIWLPQWPSSSSSDSNHPNGEIFVFESGSFVSWGISPEEASQFLEKIIRPKLKDGSRDELEVNPSQVPEKETIDYLESNIGQMFEVDADQIVVRITHQPTSSSSNPSPHPSTSETTSCTTVASTRKLLNPFMPSSSVSPKDLEPPSDLLLLSKLAVSSALSRACRLSRFEAQLDEFLSKVEHVPPLLKSGNDSPLNKNEIIARYGELLELRQSLSLKEENLIDLPEWFWEDTGAEERHFKKVLKEFDFERRLRVLNDKLSMAIELQSRLFEFSNSKYSHRLEWIIILLIAFEIAHAIYVADHYS